MKKAIFWLFIWAAVTACSADIVSRDALTPIASVAPTPVEITLDSGAIPSGATYQELVQQFRDELPEPSDYRYGAREEIDNYLVSSIKAVEHLVARSQTLDEEELNQFVSITVNEVSGGDTYDAANRPRVVDSQQNEFLVLLTAPCGSCSNYPSTTHLYVVAQDGYWHIGSLIYLEASFWVEDHWVVVADMTPHNGGMGRRYEVWHVSQQDETWRQTYVYPLSLESEDISGISMCSFVMTDQSGLIVECDAYLPPPCEFAFAVDDNDSSGRVQYVYEWETDKYQTVDRTVTVLSIYDRVNQRYLESWEQHCLP